MSPIIPSRYGHPKYNIFPQKTRATTSSAFKQNHRGTPGGAFSGGVGNEAKSSRRKQRVEESKITVQPNENGTGYYGDGDEGGDNFYSKQLAAARFQRNHRLINVLFSDIVVDHEMIPEQDKLQAFKKRVQSLTEYQRKIDAEMIELNEKFQTKKAKIADDGKKFSDKLTDFVVNSKKELEKLRAAQEIRRQQEAVRRQQAKVEAEAAAALKPHKTPTTTTSETTNNNQKSDKETPMDISVETKSGGDSLHYIKDDVHHILDGIIESVANSVQLLPA